MSALAIRDVAIERTETALVLPDGLPEAAWRSIGEDLGRDHRASAWWVGDWINYGEGAGYISREKYESAAAITGLSRNTLRLYAHVARRYESFRRLNDLPFAHHQSVAALPPADQDSVLARAAAEGWPITRLRQETRSHPIRHITSQRRHQSVVDVAAALVKTGGGWDEAMTESLTPPQARKQLTVLNKAAALLAEVIEAVEYRAATPHRFMGH